MNTAIIKEHQVEFAVVWQTLNAICQRTEPGDLLRLEVQRASDTMLQLMRSAGCLEPGQELADAAAPQTIGAV